MITSGTLRQQLGLIVEDDSLYARTLQGSLRKRGFNFEIAGTTEEALSVAAARRIDLAIIDLYLGTQPGLDLIAPLREKSPDIRILILTGYGSFSTAVQAIKRGAHNYLLKPATVEAILQALFTEGETQTQPPARMTSLPHLEWEHIQQALKATMGNISAAARLLGMHRRSLQRKLARRPEMETGPDEMPFD